MTNRISTEYPLNDIRNRNSTLSKTFSSLKWILALTVVADHFIRVTGLRINGTALPMESYPGLNTLFLLIVSFLKNYAVPVFFFMSGFLFISETNSSIGKYADTIKRRVTRLLIPFFIWGLFGITVTLLFTIVHSETNGGNIELLPFYTNGNFNIWQFLITLFGLNGFPVYNIPLWYMRDLIAAICLLPIALLVFKILDWRIYIAIAAIIFICIFDNGRSFRPEVATLFFYSGFLMRRHNIDILSLFGKIFPYALILYPILALTHFFFIDDSSYRYLAIIARNVNICLFLPLTISGTSKLVSAGWLKGNLFFATASFIIFVTHHPLITFFKSIVFRTLLPEEGSIMGTICIIIAYILIVASLTLFTWILTKYTPRLLRILTGGR